MGTTNDCHLLQPHKPSEQSVDDVQAGVPVPNATHTEEGKKPVDANADVWPGPSSSTMFTQFES